MGRVRARPRAPVRRVAGAGHVRGRDHLPGGPPGPGFRRSRGGRRPASSSTRRARPPGRAARDRASSTSTAASRSARARSRSRFGVAFQSPERTLSDEDAAALRERIVDAVLLIAFGAELRGLNSGFSRATARLEHLALDLGRFLEQALERARGDTRVRRGDVAVTVAVRGSVGDQRDLAEEVARAEGVDLLAALGDVGRALEDDEELAPAIALAHQLLAVGEVDLVGGGGDLLELVLRASLRRAAPS